MAMTPAVFSALTTANSLTSFLYTYTSLTSFYHDNVTDKQPVHLPVGKIGSNVYPSNITNFPVRITGNLDGLCKRHLCRSGTGHLANLCVKTYPYIVQQINDDDVLSQQISSAARVILILLFTIIIIITVIGNLLVIITFIVNKNMRSVTNIFILSLAISDLFVIVICAPINMSTAINVFWTFSSFACKVVPFLITFVVACSSLTLCCIALDRYFAIVHPLLQTPTRAFILKILVWVISGVASIPYSLFFDKVEHAACPVAEERKYLCMMVGHENLRAAYETWVTPIILFLGPFLIMSGLYAVICLKLWKQRPLGATGITQETYDGSLRLKKKAIKMLITVVIIFFLCWTPILCFNGIARKYDLKITRENLNWRAFLQCLALSSCCWNPIVYAFMDERFRKAFTALLICWRKKRVYPVPKGNNGLRTSTESRKTPMIAAKPDTAS